MELREAYRATLGFLRGRKLDYQHTFGGPAGQRVLRDLATFCRADRSCFDADPRLHAVAEGRREVWLRIQNHLRLTPDQLYALLGGVHVDLTEKDDAS